MHIHAVALVVPDYDDAISFYVAQLGFELRADISLSETKRWVLVAPPDGQTQLLLAKADDDIQTTAIGNQTGGRVGFFLHSDDFDADHARLIDAGVHFEETPRTETYGKVAVFQDPYGNRWDLLQLI